MSKVPGSPQMRKAYQFLVEAENNSTLFSIEDLATASGWTLGTAISTRSKKLKDLLKRENDNYKCVGISRYSEDSFCRLCSQTSTLAKDPEKPPLGPEVEGLIIKAREAALAAVQHYNNPTSIFRSGNYIILMVIAFTSLFHAIFKRDKVNFEDATRKTKNGKPYLWDAERSVNYYATYYKTKIVKSELAAIVKNLELMVPIRNDIEHQFMPELDHFIVGHCQAMLMNFERILIEEFTNYYTLNTSLSLALQFSTQRSVDVANSLKRFQSDEFQELRKEITRFHASLPLDIYTNPSFAFKVYLIPKIGNHPNSSDVAIEFVPLHKIDPLKVAELENSIIAIKEEKVEVLKDTGKTHPYLQSEVVDKLQKSLGKKIVNRYDVQSIIKVFDIKSKPEFFYQSSFRTALGQYSEGFINWIILQFTNNPDFFIETRTKSKVLN